jgi:polyisoprenoid-binding protein YceI
VHATKPLSEDATVRYVIDPKGSTFVAQVFAAGLLASFGHSPRIAIHSFEGDVSFALTGLSLEAAMLRINIQADSLEVIDQIDQKDKDAIHRKMSEEALEVDRFPEIVYQCSRVSASGSGDRFWVAMNGELTLHGVTRPMPVTARAVVSGDSVRATGEFTVKPTDYEMPPVTAAAGAIRIKNEVRLTFDIVARKQE